MSNKSKLNTAIGIGILILIIGGILYNTGYRLTDHYWIGKIGQVHITLALPNTTVIIDQNTKITTTKDNETVTVPLSPRHHNIIVTREGYFPWTKNITVPTNGSVSLKPFFVSQNQSGQIITQNDPEYWTIKYSVQTKTLPTKDNPLVASDNTRLWVEENSILTQLGTSTVHTVITPDTIVRNVSFYKNRSDAIIFSTYNSVYVIESSTDSIQNFMPLYKGGSPLFIPVDENSLYVLDGDTLMQVVI
jgi:hypothetical protein